MNENRVADAVEKSHYLTPRSQARLSERLKQRAHRSRVHHIVRLVSSRSLVYRDGSVVRSALPVSRVCGSGFNVSHLSRDFARVLVPRAAVLARPLQRLRCGSHRPFARRARARHVLVPRAVVLARPLQNIEVARAACAAANMHVLARPLQPRWPPPPRTRKSCPTGSRSRATTSESRGGPPRRARAVCVGQPRTLQHVEVRLAANAQVHVFHGQSFARAHFSISRWPPPAAHAHVCSWHGQSFSRAHFSTSRWVALRRARARLLVPRAAILVRPLQHIKVAAIRRFRARPLVPRAAVLARPLQHLEVAALRRVRARRLIPRNYSARRSAFNASRSPTLAAAAHTRHSSCSRPRRRRHLSVFQ